MQFVSNGPDVPERLLQAHEDGRVVFFCGAGVSYPAGLPSFAELTQEIYDDLHVKPDAVQEVAINAKQFDRTIGRLEEMVGRDKVRQTLAKILTPDPEKKNATATHDALLTLSRSRDERTRLVTTNFDRLFEKVITDKKLNVSRCQAPLLRPPKNRWNELVYLHGLLPANAADGNLDDLVVSSGDFGLAYLTERWAARFVSELFRNFTVCFVGYSIDDPVLRYMTDALAADRLLGESPLEMFAFGSYSEGQEDERTNEWTAKNVTPILYREDNDHTALHQTLRLWAETYRDGISGKESIVTRHAGSHPTKSTEEENFVGRILWALSDPSGLPAKRFADFDPVPPLEWLETFSEDIYGRNDLSRFDVQPNPKPDNLLEFSLIRRPSPYTRAPWMTLVDEGTGGNAWDNVMYHLARWLMRHLDDPNLVLWLTQRGGRIHGAFAEHVELRLKELDELERDGKTDELNRIRDKAPRAIPRPMMRSLWRLLLAGRVKTTGHQFDMFHWRRRFECDGLTAVLRMELRDLLTPRVFLREPFPWPALGDSVGPERLKDLVDWKVVLTSDNVHPALHDLRQSPRWSKALPDLLDDFGALLRDAMDLARELGGANEREDRSYIYQPSIAAHPQNMHLPDRAALIELTRDAWLATKEIAPERARCAAEIWCAAPYPVFRRLAFFAATEEGVIPPRQGLDWLLAGDNWWLWSMETKREAMRLLVALALGLDSESLAQLEQAVLAGWPLSMCKDDINPKDRARLVEREVWQRLAMMDNAGAALGTDAKAKLDELSSRHPEWQLETDGRDEFPIWTGDGGELKKSVAAPRHHRELVNWLKQNPGEDVLQDDDWSRRCQDNFRPAAWALCTLARDNTWPAIRWGQALHVWSEERSVKRSWRYIAPVLTEASVEQLQPLAHEIGRWLEKVGKHSDPEEALFFRLCQAILDLDFQDDADEGDDDPVGRAINHPVGHVTEALLNWWTRGPLKDRQGLPNTLRSVFTELCNVRIDSFRHGRVVLASRVITLFRVDGKWATQHLLPLFDWHSCKTEARAAWSGFFWSPRLDRSLMESIKGPFLDTASHYGTFDPYGPQYAALLTSAALDRGDTFTDHELEAATGALPEDGLCHAAEVLVDALEAAGGQRTEFWCNRVRPYLRAIWPQQLNRRTPAVSECLGRLCVASHDAFSEALKELRPWLQPPQYPGRLMQRLKDSQVCSESPEPALGFLKLVTGDEPPLGSELAECLEQIRSAAAQLEDDPRFQRLRELLRTCGQELE